MPIRRGGYYVYLILPEGLNDIALAREAARQGIFIAPGSVFCVDKKTDAAGIRVNVARADDVRFYDFLSSSA